MKHRLTMKKYFLIICCLVVLAVNAQERPKRPEPQVVELSGRLKRPVKWTPQLEIVPAGQVPRIDLQGELLRDIKEGTPIRVRGVMQTRLHRGSTKENLSPFPAQWIIELHVTELEVMADVMDVLK